MKTEEQETNKGKTSASAEATADKTSDKKEAKGEDTKAKGGEGEKDQDTDKKATADKPTEKEEAKEEEDAPKKKRKSDRQEEAAEFEDEGEATEIKVEAKAEMVVKIQNGHVSISTGKVELPVFGSGDTITVHYKIREGNKERIQQFQGVVIQRRGSHTTETCTIRKVSGGIGVERIFPLHSPFIDKIVVSKRGKVRRARIFYLRDLKGKKARIQEKKN